MWVLNPHGPQKDLLTSMKTSILIIAHNEEKYIKDCIESVLNQTQKADEVILVAHNCSDRTLDIASKYSLLKTINYNGEPGIVYARIEGLRHVSGEVILCIDGDSIASTNWVEVMTQTLFKNSNILVGSWVKLKGTFIGNIYNISNKYFCVSKNDKACQWIWGPSFAFYYKDISSVIKFLEESISLSRKINLSRNPDDYWLALYMRMLGNIEVTNKTYVIQNTKETSSTKLINRDRENRRNALLIRKFYKENFSK